MSKELKTIFGVNSISWVLLVFPILCLLLAFIAGLQVEKHKHRKELQEVSYMQAPYERRGSYNPTYLEIREFISSMLSNLASIHPQLLEAVS